MRNRILLISSALILVMVVAMSMAVLVAQAPSGNKALPTTTTNTEAAVKAAADAFKAANALKAYTVPKTPWGDPDLRGVWNTATYTRLQRPEALGNKAFYTE
jgi:Flp pilus assembly protein CpaB